ncbi:hypothetical protein F5B18DRAFT_639423 [Nemania serpens]|nr:hypothetical protein F5B18DRAFT_639423 [Nemania serpens]
MGYELGFGCPRTGNQDRCITYDSAKVLSQLQAWKPFSDEIFCSAEGISEAFYFTERFYEAFGPTESLHGPVDRQDELLPQECLEDYEGDLILDAARHVTQNDIIRLTKIFGRKHELILDLTYTLSRILEAQGRWREAESLGIAHHHPTHIPELHWSLGCKNEAQVLQTCIHMLRTATGNQFDERLSIISMVARKYADRESSSAEFKMAKILQAEVVEALKKTFGETDPRTLKVMSDMAFICFTKCEYEEAEEWQAWVLETHIDLFGVAHTDTLVSMMRMREIYFSLENWDEYFELVEKVKEIRATLGLETVDKYGDGAWDDS